VAVAPVPELSRPAALPAIPSVVLNGANIFPSYYDGLSLKLENVFSENGLSFLSSVHVSKTIDYLDSIVNGALVASHFPNPTRFNIRSTNRLPASTCRTG